MFIIGLIDLFLIIYRNNTKFVQISEKYIFKMISTQGLLFL
jgi:hypothetical protein